jgi:hypothetical protein
VTDICVLLPLNYCIALFVSLKQYKMQLQTFIVPMMSCSASLYSACLWLKSDRLESVYLCTFTTMQSHEHLCIFIYNMADSWMNNCWLISALPGMLLCNFYEGVFCKAESKPYKNLFFASIMHSQHKLNTSKIFMRKLNVVKLCCDLI